MNSDAYSGIRVWLFETGSTRYSECESRCNEQAQVSKLLMLKSIHYHEWCVHRSEEAQIVNSKVSFGFYALFS